MDKCSNHVTVQKWAAPSPSTETAPHRQASKHLRSVKGGEQVPAPRQGFCGVIPSSLQESGLSGDEAHTYLFNISLCGFQEECRTIQIPSAALGLPVSSCRTRVGYLQVRFGINLKHIRYEPVSSHMCSLSLGKLKTV